jgi:amidase
VAAPPALADVHRLSLLEVAKLLERRAISPVELTELMLARVASEDGRLHAYFAVLADGALTEARKAESEIASGRYRGPLHGVPIAVKDLCDVAGAPTTAGTRVMASRVADRDATVVARLRSAGAVLLGKLAMTEGAYAEHHPDYAVPVNPWNPAAWTGVSSSGSGVATAAGLCFASLGSDTGGSIRFPSAMNGLVGIKPTYGRVPVTGVFPMAPSLDHVGPMARTVADAAAVLQSIAGHDEADPTSAPVLVHDYVAAAQGPSNGAAGLRVGVDRSSLADLDEEICAKFDTALHHLADAGARIVEVELPAVAADLSERWIVTCGSEMLVGHAAFFPSRAGDYGPALRMALELAQGMPAEEYARTHLLRLRFAGELTRLFNGVDVFACPSIGISAPAGISVLDPEVAQMMGKLMRFTAPFNFSGSPTISLPCGLRSDGVPASLQLVGRHFEETTLIGAAAAYEANAERVAMPIP